MVPVILWELKPSRFNKLEAGDVQVVAGDPLQEFSKKRALDTPASLYLTLQVFSEGSIDFLKYNVPLLHVVHFLLPSSILGCSCCGFNLSRSFRFEDPHPFRVSWILSAELNELALCQARATTIRL